MAENENKGGAKHGKIVNEGGPSTPAHESETKKEGGGANADPKKGKIVTEDPASK